MIDHYGRVVHKLERGPAKLGVDDRGVRLARRERHLDQRRQPTSIGRAGGCAAPRFAHLFAEIGADDPIALMIFPGLNIRSRPALHRPASRMSVQPGVCPIKRHLGQALARLRKPAEVR